MGWDESACEPLEPTMGSSRGDHRTQSQAVDKQRPGDRKQLKQSFLTILTEHPIFTLLVVLLFGALVFSRVLP